MHAILLESHQKLARMQNRVDQTRCNNITFNESQIPVTEQMDKMYEYLKQAVNEFQLELNTLSGVAESFFPAVSSPEASLQRRPFDEIELNTRTRRLIGAVAALASDTGFIPRRTNKRLSMQHTLYFQSL